MKFTVELTKGMNFAAWEGGSFNSKLCVGNSILLAGNDCEKLNVVYDVPVNRAVNHFLFILDVGHLVAQAQVTITPKGTHKMRIVLSKITKLFTENVQGHAVCRSELETVWICQKDYDNLNDMLALNEYEPDSLGYREEHKAFMVAALEKAMTVREDQRLFWGTPRKAAEHV